MAVGGMFGGSTNGPPCGRATRLSSPGTGDRLEPALDVIDAADPYSCSRIVLCDRDRLTRLSIERGRKLDPAPRVLAVGAGVGSREAVAAAQRGTPRLSSPRGGDNPLTLSLTPSYKKRGNSGNSGNRYSISLKLWGLSEHGVFPQRKSSGNTSGNTRGGCGNSGNNGKNYSPPT